MRISIMTCAIFGIVCAFAGVNKQYGNCSTNGTAFSYAPDSLVVNGGWRYQSVLTADDYEKCGWWQVVDVQPIVGSNEVAVATGWRKVPFSKYRQEIDVIESNQTNEYGEVEFEVVTNTIEYTAYRIERTYRTDVIPTPAPTPRRWTRRAIIKSATRAGSWRELKTFMEEADAYELFMASNYLAEDDEDFIRLMTAARQVFGDEFVDRIIDNAEVGE